MSGEASLAPTARPSLAANRLAAYHAPLARAGARSPWIAQQAQLLAFITADLSAFLLAMGLAYIARPTAFAGRWEWREADALSIGTTGHVLGLVAILAVLLCYLASRSHYTERVPFWIESRDLLGACALALLCDVLLKTAIYHVDYTREFALRWMMFVPALLLCRGIARRLLDRLGLWQLDTLIIGPEAAASRIAAALTSEPALGYRVLGVLDPEQQQDEQVLGNAHTDTAAPQDRAQQAWPPHPGGRQANFLAIASGCGNPATEARLIAMAYASRLPFALVPAAEPVPVVSGRPHYFLSHDVAMIAFRNNLARPLARMLKLAFDVVAATSLLVLMSPLLLAIAALVRLDGGPALYRHKRIGAGGTPFFCMKFRTMRVNADALLTEILARDEAAAAEWAATQKLRNDPRITPIGQVLRKTSLDELPQLFNVLRGEMSLVGPRPIVTSEVAFYGSHISYYYETKPGITGLWQVSGRSDTSYPRRVQLDVWYVRNWTLWHDVAILLKTVPAVLLKRGAV